MNILIANYRYFFSGGPERYLFNVINLFQSKDHKTIPFSIDHPLNNPTPYSKYFLSAINGQETGVYYREIKKTPRVVARMLERNFYSFEARRKIDQLLKTAKIDVAYLLHFLRWMSPSILDVLRQRRIPIIVRLSDFLFLCPAATFLRKKSVCELCKTGNIWPSVKYQCLQNSRIVSTVNALAAIFHKFARLFDRIDAFICPTEFMLTKMKDAGYSPDKLFHIPTFVPIDDYKPHDVDGGYVLYYGRISKEKGVELLVDAFSMMKVKDKNLRLIVVGRSHDGESERIKTKLVKEKIENVEVREEVPADQMRALIRDAMFVVVPSICYDNMPNTIIESYAAGKSVLASDFGSFPELVDRGETGLLFKPGDAGDLKDKIEWMTRHPGEIRRMGIHARRNAERLYNPELHYERLLSVFKSVMQKYH